MELKQSKVEFIEDGHKYFLGKNELQGITGVLKRQLFPSDYAGIPEDVLSRAAEYGTMVHKACQSYDENGDMPMTDEVAHYAVMTKDMKHERSEYLVSDNISYASAIDKVFRVNTNTFDLGDIKTCSTGTMNIQKLRWQLSIYATLFEKQNPRCHVRKLFGIWIRTKGNDNIHEIIPVERIPDEEVLKLLEADWAGEQYQAPAEYTQLVTMPTDVVMMQQGVIKMMQEADALKAKLDELKAGLLQRMEQSGVKSWEGDLLKMTRVEPSSRTTFDAKGFMAAHPELADEFDKFNKTTQTKSSIKLTIKK